MVPLTYQWENLQNDARKHSGDGIPVPLKQDALLLLLFVNIFPFRANVEALMFLHKRFDGTWFL
jgi:hypothetical protein